MSGDRCQGQANWSQTSPSAPGDLREPWGNFENYRERNWDYPEQNWAFVNKQICAFLRILFMSTALATKWKWGIVYTNTGKSLASILLGKGFLVKKDIQYKPCCEKSQSVNKQTDQRKDKVTLSPSTGSVRKLFITFIVMVGKEGVGWGGEEAFCARSRNLRTSFCVLFHGQFVRSHFCQKYQSLQKKTQSLVLSY